MITPDPFPGWGTLKKEGEMVEPVTFKRTCVVKNCRLCEATDGIIRIDEHGVVHHGDEILDPEQDEMGGLERIAVEWNQEEKEKPLQLSEFCPTCHKQWVSGSLVSSNRFDPYEALDEIEQIVEGLGVALRPVVSGHLHALRAYITGMEK